MTYPAVEGASPRLQGAVSEGISNWRERTPMVVDGAKSGVMARLPRRVFVKSRIADTAPPQMRFVTFRASRRRAAAYLFVWLAILLYFAAGVAWDWLRGRRSQLRNAARLRRTFERAGGLFVKIGQHLALRIDLLPWAYSTELAGMSDRMAAIPFAGALRRIEQATGRPLADTFAQFDPEPIGSTSLACVYQAILKNGRKVVVKVRRPEVGERFMAHFRVFDWLGGAIEFLTFMRPGHTKGMRRELRESLIEELDFIQESRYQDSFRRAARKSGRKFFTAPRVFFDLSNEEVIVEEYIAGIWLWELLAGLEQQNPEVLALVQQLEIDPKKVARRLMWVNFWGWHEHLFFHADPHPENIIVGPGSDLVFIDFGSVGALDRTKRLALQQNMYYASRQDPLNMARSSLILLEPLPPLDMIEFTKELESHNWQMLYVFESPKVASGRLLRSTAVQWLGLIEVARRYGVTIDFHVLRLLQANLAYEMLALRLDPGIHVVNEYHRFTGYQARRAGRRARRNISRTLTRRPDDKIFLRLERLLHTGEGLLARTRHLLAIPSVNFNSLMSKWSFAVYTAIRFTTQAVVLTGAAVLLLAGAQYLAAGQVAAAEAAAGETLWRQVVSHRLYQFLMVLLVFLNGRALLFRLDDKDV
jgi:ubiquinone biosynthesis protein